MAKLDKFYTSTSIARSCISILNMFITVDSSDCYLEPTAGNGAFINFLDNYEAYDIEPEDPRIKEQDIFKFVPNRNDYITIGNPPFGKRSKMAIDVFNTVAKYSNVIAFIVPVSFLKYNVQKELDSNFKLIHNYILPENSFLDRDKVYNVNCVFQIWVKTGSRFDTHPNIRLLERPKTKCDDFKIWQYNATQGQFKVVNEDWTIAVYRQGYKDYKRIFTQNDKQLVIDEMNGTTTGKKVQFFFIKPLNEVAEAIINKIDFEKLANRNTSIPGFGKADFVEYYNELKKDFEVNL